MENITIDKADRREVVQSLKITFFINTLIAFFNNLIVPPSSFIEQFLAAQSIGLTIVSIILVANLLFPALLSKFRYQYYFLPFPALIATLIGLNFLHQYVTFIQLYFLVLVASLPALFVFQYRNSHKLAKLSLNAEKQKRDLSEKQLVESKLLLLQAQINPHFLFNTLANIDAYIETDPKKAKFLLQHYSDFLRFSLHNTQSSSATINSEVELINAYIHIQKTRFANIKFNQEIDNSLLSTPLAPLLIQPLIENALLHGLAPQGNKGEISLTIARHNQQLIISVKDNGIGLDTSKEPNNGVAVNNIRSRLALYKSQAKLTLTNNKSGGCSAVIYLPI